jgi:hypothetical protein
MTETEPARPQRGQTAEERGRDVSAAQAQAEDAPTAARRLAATANPRFLLSQADGYPVGIKQFLQFCLILVYPAFLFSLLVAGVAILAGKAIYAVWWVLLAPLRLWMKRNRPEDYAASQRR